VPTLSAEVFLSTTVSDRQDPGSIRRSPTSLTGGTLWQTWSAWRELSRSDSENWRCRF